jgi:putative ABC transport system permease protein
MLRNNLKFFVRIFLKDKFYSMLNILGLALGIAVSIILLLILQNDLTYDQHHANHKRIYRIGTHVQATGLDVRLARAARELGPILKDEVPEVENFVRVNDWGRTMVKYQPADGGEKAFNEENIARSDSNFFEIFTHKFIAGDRKTCLAGPNSLVVTQSTATRYFGDDDPINKSLLINNELFNVTAVIGDVPENSHLKFDILLSQLPDRGWTRQEDGQLKSEAFWNPDAYLYVMFPEGYNTADFEPKYHAVFDRYFKPFGDQVGGVYNPPILQSLASIHFHSDLDADEPQGNIAYLYAFTGIGVFIILLACINYMNLSTAKSVNRAAEIAMKKTFGSGKAALALSFLGESIFLSFVALLLAVAIVFLVLNATSFSQLIGKNLTLDFLHNPLLVAGAIIITVGIGFISGLYPAFYLPAIPTIQTLKGSYKNRKSSLTLRKALITTQFVISIFVVVCTLFMQDQIDFVRNKELGFDKENILLLPVQDTLVQNQISSIKQEFLKYPAVKGATTSYHVPGMNVSGGSVMWAETEEGPTQQSFALMFVGEDYLKTMNITLLDGRDFLPGPQADVENVFIANEAAARKMGWGEDAVGKKVKFFHAKEDGQVIGLVKDFNFASLHNSVEPLLLIKARKEGGFVHLRLQGNLPETIDYIQERWAGFDPNHPFEYSFLDQRFNEQYKEDETQYKLLSGLSGVCIFISLLGLFGLSAFAASQRTKEIGIRKVHGASVPNIIFMLSRDVMVLVILAAILVVPIAHYMISDWMGNFAYQTPLNYSIFLLVAVFALLFTFLAVAFQSLKTARTNPVESLKYE